MVDPTRPGRIAAGVVCAGATALVLALAALAVREAASMPSAPVRSDAGGQAELPLGGVRAFRPNVPPITLERLRDAGLSEREAMYYEKLPGREVQCTLCPKACLLAEGARGQCRVRANFGGRLHTLVYGKAVSRAIDPIEKKPLLHFLPGSKILSVATAGCVLRCRFCQNWQISQAFPEEAPHGDWSPEQMVADALRYGCPSIAFTYTEPSIFYEYMLATARLAEEKGIRTVWVTCGYLNEEPLVELCKYLDGANVDLKGFTEEFYREYFGARLQPVLDTLKILRREKVYFEVTNLVIPGGNDDPEMIRKMCEWIRDELGAETPLHFSRYFPNYQMKRPGPTPIETLLGARAIARKAGLEYVYVGNVRAEGGDTTSCPKCGEELIRRWGYVLESNIVKDGACPKCATKLPGVWPEAAPGDLPRSPDAK